MKTNKKIILVVVFMLGTLFSYANNDKGLNNIVNTAKVEVAFKNAKIGHKLTIKDENGTKLHTEIVSKEGKLNKVFNLSNLEDGKYTVELNKDYEIIVKTLEVKGNKVIYNKASKKTIFKPVVRNKENLLMISKIAFDNKPIKIALYFEGNVIFSETVKNKTIVNRTYKLDTKETGNYKAIIYSNNRSYVHSFKI
jgi:hypothetical protein